MEIDLRQGGRARIRFPHAQDEQVGKGLIWIEGTGPVPLPLSLKKDKAAVYLCIR